METQYCLQSRVGRGDQKPEYGSISTNKISSILEKGNENEEMNAGVPSSASEAVATSVVEHKTGSSSSSDASGGQLLFWVPGWAYLVLFVLLYSANNVVLSGLMARGYPFTICNIMCIGNVVGVLTLFPVFHRQLRLAHLKRVTPLQWGWMLLGCLLSNVLGSVAYLQGLRLTSVPARAMTGRLESVDFLAASACFIGDRYSAWVQANALLTVLGVVAAVLYPVYVQHHPWEGMVGYSFLVLGGWGYTLSLIITKKYLVQLPVGLLSLFKLAIGTLLFHLLSVSQHGAMDVPSLLPSPSLYPSSLLRTMLWYAPLFVTSTQVLWLRAVKFCSPSVLSIGMNANFVVTVLMGGLILGTWPTTGELVGGAVIVGSIVSGVTETVVEKRGESVVEDTREVAEEEGRYECGRETTKESIRPRLSYGEEDAEETAMLHGGSACRDTREIEKVSLWNIVRQ